jgi:hypothetical protein
VHNENSRNSPTLSISQAAESPPPQELKSGEMIHLNLSPTGLSSSGVSSDSQHLGESAHLNALTAPGPISSAIAAASGIPLTDYRNQIQPDYSNYYSAFYQSHPSDPNSLSAQSYSHFPNHHFTVSSLIQKPQVGYPKL